MTKPKSTSWFSAACFAVALLPAQVLAEVKFHAPERLEIHDLNKLEGPEIVDYDGDGVRDLLSGNYAGNIIFRKNTGTNAAPKYAAPTKLQRAGKDIKLKHW